METSFHVRIIFIPIALALLLVLTGCGGTYVNPRYEDGLVTNPSVYPHKSRRPDTPQVVTFFGLGDWGTGNQDQCKVAQLLKAELAGVGGRTVQPVVLGLGDNHYPDGLVNVWDEEGLAAKQLEKSFGVYRDLKVDDKPVVFHVVHGNHDHRGDLPMWESLAEGIYDEASQGAVLKTYNLSHPDITDSNDYAEYESLMGAVHEYEVFLPEVVSTGAPLVRTIALDTQILLNMYQIRETEEMARTGIENHWDRLDALLTDDPPQWTVVMGHHPLRTHGKHGGSFVGNTWWHRFKKLCPTKDLQDLEHPANIAMREDLETLLSRAPNTVIYLAGHEHNLQFLKVNERLLQVVSGSAGKTTGVQGKEDTLFCSDQLGFVRFDVTPSEMWVEFLTLDQGTCSPVNLFRIVPNQRFD